MDAGRGADGCREGDDHGAFLVANGGWMQELVGFRSPLVARATADEGVSDARPPPGGAQQLALVTMVAQISLREIKTGGTPSLQPLLSGGSVMGQGSRKSTVCPSRSRLRLRTIQTWNRATAGYQSLVSPHPTSLSIPLLIYIL